jgi:hypothetical protein
VNPDTAFRQQRLKAWQYVGSCVPRTYLDADKLQTHPDSQDRSSSLLRSWNHIRAHWRSFAICKRTGEIFQDCTWRNGGGVFSELTIVPSRRSNKSRSTTPDASRMPPLIPLHLYLTALLRGLSRAIVAIVTTRQHG